MIGVPVVTVDGFGALLGSNVGQLFGNWTGGCRTHGERSGCFADFMKAEDRELRDICVCFKAQVEDLVFLGSAWKILKRT